MQLIMWAQPWYTTNFVPLSRWIQRDCCKNTGKHNFNSLVLRVFKVLLV